MGFKENLKDELVFLDMRVKELAQLSGVKKQTIDSYLRTNSYVPSAVAAVNIARVLGVSVEYLVTGKESNKGEILTSLHNEIKPLVHSLEQLNRDDRKIVIDNALNLVKKLQDKNRTN
jgi:transcriptional regulator with XRE-family HTH domain